MAVAVMSDRQDSMWMTAIINEAKRGWRRAQRRCGRYRRRIGYARPIAAAAVLEHLHSTMVRWRPRAWKLGVSADSVRVVRVRSQTTCGSRRYSAEDVRKNEVYGLPGPTAGVTVGSSPVSATWSKPVSRVSCRRTADRMTASREDAVNPDAPRPVDRLIPRGIDFPHDILEVLPVGECACDSRQSDGARRTRRIHLVRGNERHHGRVAASDDNPLAGSDPSDQRTEAPLGLRNAVTCDSYIHAFQSAESCHLVKPASVRLARCGVGR